MCVISWILISIFNINNRIAYWAWSLENKLSGKAKREKLESEGGDGQSDTSRNRHY